MSWKDQGKAARAILAAREGVKSVGYGSFGQNRWDYGYQNPILKVLGTQQDNEDPRVKLPTYRALTHNLTIIQRAIGVHRDFIGSPQIVVGEKGNPRAVAILERFWADTPIYGSRINPIAADKGIGSFVTQMIDSTFGDGSQFTRLMQEPTTARVNKAPIEGIRLFDSIDFDYVQDPTDLERVLLSYVSPNLGQIYVTPEMGYSEFHFEIDRRYPWGKPIAYGAEFFARQFIEFLIAHVDGTKRKANPIGITLIGFKEPPRGGMVDTKQYAAQAQILIDETRSIKDVHKSAIKQNKTTGQPQDEILILPGDVSLSSQFYGAGIDMPPNFEEMATVLLDNLCNGLNTPFMFLGRDQGGGGLGSSLFNYQKQVLCLSTDNERRLLENNCLNRINAAVLAQNSIQITPDTYSYEWITPDLSDEKLEAETRKLDAEAVAQELINITTISTSLSGVADPTQAQNDYADEIGRESWRV
jgi:hypothetical protein